MHPVLLIDEILDVIINALSEEGAHNELVAYRDTLCKVARTCKAWCDPALNRLWRRLQSAEPLAQLLPGCIKKDDNSLRFVSVADHLCPEQFARFNSYARRVEFVEHALPIHVPPAYAPFISLPRLSAVRVTYMFTPPTWCLSDSVRSVSLSVRHVTSRRSDPEHPLNQAKNSALCQYLDVLATYVPQLERLAVRGCISYDVNRRIAALTSLTALDLQVGSSLCAETFVALATCFPRLCELNVNARWLIAEDIRLALPADTHAIFPSLRKLCILADIYLLEIVLPRMPDGVLEELTVDPTGVVRPVELHDLFACLATKFAHSLAGLRVECHFDWDDAGVSAPGSALAGQWFTLALLQPLARLSNLRRFGLAACMPPMLADADIKTMGHWWCQLEDLDLGTPDDCAEDGSASGVTLTPAALVHLARACPRLASLTLPMDVPSEPGALPAPDEGECRREGCTHAPVMHRALRRLQVGSLPPARASAEAWRVFLGVLFPFVDEAEAAAACEEESADLDPELQQSMRSRYAHLLSHT